MDAELEKPENQDVMVGRVKKAKRYATPLLLCVAVVELSDVMFAFDSVPAIIAVSREPLIIYSAMMFAILGLRTLYFVLEALKQYLVHLEKAVVLLLFFVAFKLGLNATDHFWHHGYSIGATASLFVVLRAGAGNCCERDVPGETRSLMYRPVALRLPGLQFECRPGKAQPPPGKKAT